jgi:hypothetical protein
MPANLGDTVLVTLADGKAAHPAIVTLVLPEDRVNAVVILDGPNDAAMQPTAKSYQDQVTFCTLWQGTLDYDAASGTPNTWRFLPC